MRHIQAIGFLLNEQSRY